LPENRRISIVFGTRPEAIKLAPVVLGCRAREGLATSVCVTAQHREMLDQVLETFGIVPDVDLALMTPDQSLPALSARAIEAIDRYLGEVRPDLVLVQGDTTTTFCAALAAFYQSNRLVPNKNVQWNIALCLAHLVHVRTNLLGY